MRLGRGLASVVVFVLFLGVAVVGLDDAAAQAPVPGPLPDVVGQHAGPMADPVLSAVVEGRAVPASDPGGPPVMAPDGRAHVEVFHELSSEAIAALIVSLGGELTGEVPGVLAEALVPIDALVDLQAAPGVSYVRAVQAFGVPPEPPRPVEGSVAATISAVAKTGADAWHAAGFDGTGMKIGVIDFFNGSVWSAAQAAGELPAPAGTLCLNAGAPCDIWTWGGSVHGVGVSEVVHDMAPGAQLYLASFMTVSDVQAIINWLAANGVTVVNTSWGERYDGPGDGTGPSAVVANSAVSQGITWIKSAGNNAGVVGSREGSYWRGSWSDPDGDGFLNFQDGGEFLRTSCRFSYGVRWNDWGEASPTDYDIYGWNFSTGLWDLMAGADQTAGAPPVEYPYFGGNYCSSNVGYFAVYRYSAGGDTSDVLEYGTNGGGLSIWQNPHSAAGPIADSSTPGVLSVGAIDPASGTMIAEYSSWGPTNDGRMKPDISAPSCFPTVAYPPPSCMNGTSGAAPVVAGAAAIVQHAGAATTPSQVHSFLTGRAVDRGAAGPDNIYGVGEVMMGAPPSTDGWLRVVTNPAVPAQVTIGYDWRDTWGLTWLTMPPGTYSVSFSDIAGYTTPLPAVATVNAGATTQVVGTYQARGWLRVMTNPAVPATIYVDGFPRNDWGMWTDLPPGTYNVCFGDVGGYATPPCQQAVLTAGQTTTITGNYTPGSATDPVGYGYLRVTTSPPVPSQILLNGLPTDTWGLTWVKLIPGQYAVEFTDVPGYATPASQQISVTAGATTEYVGTFMPRGWLRVMTSPAVPSTITVDGIRRNDWGVWTDVPAGTHEVCWGPVPGHTPPACQTVAVAAGSTTTVTGAFT